MVAPTASLQDVVSDALPRLSPKQQRVARFLAGNEVVVAFTPATELALRLRVDPATVVRLTRSLGFQGYPDLQRHLRARFPHHYPALAAAASHPVSEPAAPNGDNGASAVLRRTFGQDQANLSQGLEQVDAQTFDAVVESLGRAHHILLFGGGVALGVVAFLGSSLRTMGFAVQYAAADGLPLVQELVSLTPDDLAFGVGFYRYVGQTVKVLARARELGVPRVVLTDSALSPLVQLADHALCAPVESICHRVSLAAPMSMANAVIAACAARYADQVEETLRRLDQEYRAAGLLTTA